MPPRYKILSSIAEGGFGQVLRAFDTKMQREVAIKRISTTQDDDKMRHESARQLKKEAEALAAIHHPNILTVHDVDEDEHGPFIVMELIEGQSLEEHVTRSPMQHAAFRELARQTQDALSGAQAHNLVHRDIKPANIMMTWLPSGKFHIKLLDFGLAKLMQRPAVQTLHHADMLFGSVHFMAPEQFEHKPIDSRTDIYAMGCVYYYALSGVQAFDGDTNMDVIIAHLRHELRPLHELRPDLPRWMCDWVQWQMNADPADRPQSASESWNIFLENETHEQHLSINLVSNPRPQPPTTARLPRFLPHFLKSRNSGNGRKPHSACAPGVAMPCKAIRTIVGGTLSMDDVRTPDADGLGLLGGSAVYASIAAALHCRPVGLISTIGEDFPEPYLEEIRKNGVSIEALQRSPGRSFTWSAEYLQEMEMEKRQTHRIAFDVLKHWHITVPQSLASCPVVVCANMSPDNQIDMLDQLGILAPQGRRGRFVAAGTGDLWIEIANQRLHDVLKHLDLLVIDEWDARELARTPNLIRAGARILSKGPRFVVVRQAGSSAMLFCRGHRLFHSDAFPLENTTDPTGACATVLGSIAGQIAFRGVGAVCPEFMRHALATATAHASFTCETFSTGRLQNVTLADIERRIYQYRDTAVW